MAICDITIKKDIAPSCDDPIVPGLEQEGVIMNRADSGFRCGYIQTQPVRM